MPASTIRHTRRYRMPQLPSRQISLYAIATPATEMLGQLQHFSDGFVGLSARVEVSCSPLFRHYADIHWRGRPLARTSSAPCATPQVRFAQPPRELAMPRDDLIRLFRADANASFLSQAAT